MFRTLIFVAASYATVALSLAQAPADPAAKPQVLAVGSPAPALAVEKWLKGQPVEKFETGKIYVIDFWSTTNSACLARMPHTTRLQAKYAEQGVTIIGVSTGDFRNSLAAVEKMVAEKSAAMGYTVAWDKGKATKDAFLTAAKQLVIPCSFLIDKNGTIAYIGDPVFLDVPLAGVLDGTWDGAKHAADYAALQKDYWAKNSRLERDPAGLLAFLKEFEARNPMLAHVVAKAKFRAAIANGEFELAASVMPALVDEAILGADAQWLNELSWGFVDPEAKVENRRLDLALKAAEAAARISAEKDGAILDTLARVWFWKGDLQKAFELQTKALAVATERFRAPIQASLDEYKAKLGNK
jgi:thiol-disulfide isomerase/thioredoxin